MMDKMIHIDIPDNGQLLSVEIPWGVFACDKTYAFFRMMLDLFEPAIVISEPLDYHI